MKTRRSHGSESEPSNENEGGGQNIQTILFGRASSGVVIPESPAVSPNKMKSMRASIRPDSLTSVVETPEDMLPAKHLVINEKNKLGQSFAKDRGKAKSLVPVLHYSSTDDDEDFIIDIRPRSASKTGEKSKNAKKSEEPAENIHTFKTPEKTNQGFASSDEDMNESTFVDVTPDVISRKKNLMGILESERSFTKTIKSQKFKNSTAISNILESTLDSLDNEPKKSKDLSKVDEGSYCDSNEKCFPRPVISPFKKNRRKSLKLEQVIMPFDLNDTRTVTAKQNMTKADQPKRRKSVCATPTSEKKKQSSKSTPKNNVFATPRSTAMALARANRRSLNLTPVTPHMNDSSSDDEIAFKGFKGAQNSIKKRYRQDNNGATVLFDSEDLSLTPIKSNSEIALHSSVTKIINSLDNSQDISDPKLSFQNFSTRSSKSMQKAAAKGKTKLVFPESDEDEVDGAAQPSSTVVLQGVIAYVEVRIGRDNRSIVVVDKLKSLGAEVRKRLTADVTHVIFKDGSKATFNRAKSRKLHIVSSLWVEECREKLTRVPEVKFPSCSLEAYSSPMFSSRVRKLKSMQPKEFSEEEDAATNKVKRRIKKIQAAETHIEDIPESPAREIRNEAVDVNSPLFGIGHLLTPKRQKRSITPSSQASTSSLDDTIKSPSRMPLAKRLYDKFITPKTSEGSTPGDCLQNKTSGSNDKNELHNSDNESSNCEVTSNLLKKNRGKLDVKDTVVRALSLNSVDDNDQSESFDLLLSDSGSDRIDINNFVNPENVKNHNCKSQKNVNNMHNKSGKLDKQPNFTHGRRRSILKSTGINCDELSPAKNRRKSVRYTLPTSERSKENVPIAPNTPHSKVKQSKVKKSLNLRNNLGNPSAQEEIPSSSQIISSQSLSSQITSSQHTLSQTRRRKLLSQELIPSQDMIIPSTPEHPAKYREDPYSQLEIQGSKTQRQAIKLTKADGNSVPLPRNLSLQESTSHNTQGKIPLEDNMSLPSTSDGRRARSRPLRKARSCEQQLPPDEVFFSSDDENTLKNSKFELLPRERRSTEEFRFNNGKFQSRFSRKPRRGARPRLCLTSIHTKEMDGLIQIIKKLGGFIIVDDVDIHTTHVVCGQQRRTLNMLYGISRGCWILDVTWLFESLEMGEWAPEEPFEIFLFCPGSKVCREQRHLKGTLYQQTLFSGVGSICVLDGCTPPSDNIKELLQLCGATLVSDKRDANIAIGRPIVGSSTRCQVNEVTHVSEKWALDSIQYHTVKNTQEYAINQSRSETRSSNNSDSSN